MGLISRMRLQTCIYWAFDIHDVHGQPTYKNPVEAECRWEDVVVEYVDTMGNRNLSQSVVYVDRDMELGGVLLLGELSSSVDEDNPLENEGAHEIRQFAKLPNLRNTETLRMVYL
jgi:hypothetical protein